MYHETIQKLENLTDSVEFERMVLDILSYLDYAGIDPQSPTLQDGGKDGLYYLYGEESCVWFAFSLQKTWKRKLNLDFKGAVDSSSAIKRFVFCTNQFIPTLERDKFKKQVKEEHKIDVDFFEGERLRVALDTVCKDIRFSYLGVVDNSVVRRQLRYILLDPKNEVASLDMCRAEGVFLKNQAPRGIFELLKGVDLASVCETSIEMKSLLELLESYFQFRLVTSKLEEYALNYVGNQLLKSNFVGFWRVIVGYCIQKASGWSDEDALRISKLQGISHNGRECEQVYLSIIKDDAFGDYMLQAKKAGLACSSCLVVVLSIKSLIEPPHYSPV